ncbi:hypothetical protein ES703_53729 [subsurface metagenome]
MYSLLPLADKVHLDSALFWIIESIMSKVVDLKIAVKLTIDTLKQIEVECCSYTLAIVIGTVQQGNIFFKIYPYQKCTVWA